MLIALFQSPRSGKFESNQYLLNAFSLQMVFQSPRSGKFESNQYLLNAFSLQMVFQSPRSGKFESNLQRTKSQTKFLLVSIP